MRPHKSILLSGNLKTKPVEYRLCPNTEFSFGQWQIALCGLFFELKSEDINLNVFCTVSTNASVQDRFSKYGDVETYQQPFITVHLKLNKDTSKTSFNFSNPVWLPINRISGI